MFKLENQGSRTYMYTII